MPPHRRTTSKALALARADTSAARVWVALFAGLALGALAAATAWGDGHEEVTVSHGYSNFGELKYGPGEAFAYVNPDAPKGGEISIASQGNFDSFNIYTRKGRAGREYRAPLRRPDDRSRRRPLRLLLLPLRDDRVPREPRLGDREPPRRRDLLGRHAR